MNSSKPKHAIIQGLKCTYKVAGTSDQSLVLLHGWGQSVAFWEDLADQLSREYKIYIVDLPGWGMSQEPATVWDTEQYANFVKEFLRHLDIQNPMLLGHSFGGRIALKFAERYHVKKLVLYSSPGVPYTSFKRKLHVVGLQVMRYLIPNILYKMHSDRLKHTSYTNTHQINRSRSRRMLDIYIHNSYEEKSPPVYKGPVLLIYGSDDKIVPPKAIQSLRSRMRSSNIKTVVIEGATHFGHLESPVAFYKHMNNFLESK